MLDTTWRKTEILPTEEENCYEIKLPRHRIVYDLAKTVIEMISDIQNMQSGRPIIGFLIQEYLVEKYAFLYEIMSATEKRTRYVSTTQVGMTDFSYKACQISDVEIWLPSLIKAQQPKSAPVEKNAIELVAYDDVDELLDYNSSDSD